MSRLFGTDGARGLANADITARLALQLAVAGSRVLGAAQAADGARPVAIVGRDTRISGEFLSAATCAGIASTGVDVRDAGILPTPGVAHAVAATGAAFGVVLSASHNPMPDNGIKFFGPGGTKLDDAVEDEILAVLETDWERPTGAAVGRINRYPAAADEFTEHLVATLGAADARPLSGLSVVVDCANGAASVVGPAALRQAGAEVIVIAAEPDGLNINDGVGSTHIGNLQAAVVEHQADLGVAFDGDADRCLAVDALGREVNGDQIMGILAIGLHSAGRLARGTLVTTVMSNLGLRLAMGEHGIDTVQTAVGDRYVLERMLADGYSLGGEQSGHVLMLDHGTTGDGVQTALHIMHRMAAERRTLADLAAEIPQLPQELVNVRGVNKARTDDAQVAAEVAAVEEELGDTGRVLLRASGTEPLIRVMVEAASAAQAKAQAQRLAAVVRDRLSLGG
ncbi:phosphoglucosamine mutase [Brevibacterium sp. 5221]|uniref:Phosphoglucosamine mutase n=1 Tax=Brevibacterium rongguiense TaxID=2695267 RepID=A0A6N9H9X1_9MICO|nr:phosphoglucosamine mutase [Brevibacterium rongguiense]MYM20302.1 phosphoglucosamine mutase [Brevibacterium rongguiense]